MHEEVPIKFLLMIGIGISVAKQKSSENSLNKF